MSENDVLMKLTVIDAAHCPDTSCTTPASDTCNNIIQTCSFNSIFWAQQPVVYLPLSTKLINQIQWASAYNKIY